MEILSESYLDITNFICLVLSAYILYDRFMRPSLYNKLVHLCMVFLECQLFLFTLMSCFQGLAKINLGLTSIIFLIICGAVVAFVLDFLIKKKE